MKKRLGVGKFTTHPSWRNIDVFQEKVVFEEIPQQLNFKDITALFFLRILNHTLGGSFEKGEVQL